MADPIAWGLALKNKALLDQIKSLIGGIDVDTPIDELLAQLKTLIESVDDNVDSVSGKADAIDDKIDNLQLGVTEIQNGVYENIRKGTVRKTGGRLYTETNRSIINVTGKGILKDFMAFSNGNSSQNCTANVKITIDGGKIWNFYTGASTGGGSRYVCGVFCRESIINGLFEYFGSSGQINDLPEKFIKFDESFSGDGETTTSYFTETGIRFNSSLTVTMTTTSPVTSGTLYNGYSGLYILED